MQKSLQSQGSLPQLPVPVSVSKAPVERLLGRLVHLDGVGPTKSDRWGNVGFYTFCDQDTGAVFVRLYKRPSEVYGIVRDVNDHFISKYGGTGIQRVRTDQHPCFMQTTSAWRDVQNHCGFHTEYSSVYTPAQNSHAERANRRLLDCARTIMNAAGLEHWSWGLAILYASQVLNHVPLRRLDGITATEALTGCAPQVHRFRIFGCTAWALIHKAHSWDSAPKPQHTWSGFLAPVSWLNRHMSCSMKPSSEELRPWRSTRLKTYRTHGNQIVAQQYHWVMITTGAVTTLKTLCEC
jgi:hypothetical protein